MAGSGAVLDARRRDLVELAALLTGDPDGAAGVVERARGRLWPRRDPARLLEAALRAVLREARRSRSPWSRRDPLAAVPAAAREVLALRSAAGLPLPAAAHLLDVPLATAAEREAAGLAAAGCPDVEALVPLLRAWLEAEVPDAPPPAAAARGSALRPLAGLVAVALLAAGGVVAVDALPTPEAPAVRSSEAHDAEPEPPQVRPSPSASGCAASTDALCAPSAAPRALPAPEGVDPRAGTPFWPFTTDRQAADWAVAPGARPWAGDPVQVAQHLVDDLLRVPGVRARGVGGGLVRLQRGGRDLGTARLVRLGRGAVRPWSVVQVRSTAVQLDDPGPLVPDGPVTGRAGGPVDVRLLAPDGRLLARADRLGGPLRWPADWTVAALVAERRDGSGLAVQPVRREGTVDAGVPPPGATFVTAVDGSVRLHDALSGEVLLQVSAPSGGARDSEPARGGRDGVVFVRTEADGCTTSVLRAALDRGASGTTLQPAALVRRLPRLAPGGGWLGWVEAPCTGGPAELVLRGPDARERRVPLGSRAVSRLDVRDDGSAVLQLRGPDRVVDLPPGVTALVPALPVPAGCTGTAAAAAGAAALVWERCGATARPVLHDGARRPLGPPGEPVTESAVVDAPDGPLVLARTSDGAVARLVGGRLVDVLPPCLRAPGCVLSLDW